MKKITTTVKCACGHETSEPIHWEHVISAYPYNLESKEFGDITETVPSNSDDNSWSCPDCGDDYPREVQIALDEVMQG